MERRASSTPSATSPPGRSAQVSLGLLIVWFEAKVNQRRSPGHDRSISLRLGTLPWARARTWPRRGHHRGASLTPHSRGSITSTEGIPASDHLAIKRLLRAKRERKERDFLPHSITLISALKNTNAFLRSTYLNADNEQRTNPFLMPASTE